MGAKAGQSLKQWKLPEFLAITEQVKVEDTAGDHMARAEADRAPCPELCPSLETPQCLWATYSNT